MGILKAVSCNSGYTPFLQTQALGPVNAHIALRNSPIFGFRAEGTSWHRLWPCAGTRCPPTHGLLFILSCMLQIISEATHVHVNPHHGPACSAVPGGTIPVPSQERGVGDTILPLRVRDPRRPSATSLLTRWPDGQTACVLVLVLWDGQHAAHRGPAEEHQHLLARAHTSFCFLCYCPSHGVCSGVRCYRPTKE